MEYKKYGKTDKMVSLIGFGGMRFPKSADNKTYDYDYCAEMIHEANRLGINYFDTAPYYNDDHSEKIFGYAFRNMPDDFYVSTKCAAWKGADLRKSLERSLKRLNVPKIDFFHIWCVMNMEDYAKRMVSGGPYEELLKAREEGLVDHICISTHCTGSEIAEIASHEMFDGITLGYNILNYSYRQEGLKAASKHSTAVVTMNPLGGGLIPKNEEYFSYIKAGDDRNVTEAAIRFNASHREITTVLTGMDSLESVRQNAACGYSTEGYVEKTIERCSDYVHPDMDALCTGCRYCEPCPSGVPVSRFMLAFNKKILSDDESMKNTIKFHWRVDPSLIENCTKCSICEKRCTQHIDIVKRLASIRKIYE